MFKTLSVGLSLLALGTQIWGGAAVKTVISAAPIPETLEETAPGSYVNQRAVYIYPSETENKYLFKLVDSDITISCHKGFRRLYQGKSYSVRVKHDGYAPKCALT